jgi:hypothetical protein
MTNPLLQKLLAIVGQMSPDDQMDVVEHALWLAEAYLIGGPCDGLRVPDRLKSRVTIGIEHNGMAAIYNDDGNCRLRFECLSQIGGEDGNWPDISAKELQELKGGDA